MENYLNTEQAAEILNITSPHTIINWLEGGEFPGSFRDPDGNWVFTEKNVIETRIRIHNLRVKNSKGDFDPPNNNDSEFLTVLL